MDTTVKSNKVNRVDIWRLLAVPKLILLSTAATYASNSTAFISFSPPLIQPRMIVQWSLLTRSEGRPWIGTTRARGSLTSRHDLLVLVEKCKSPDQSNSTRPHIFTVISESIWCLTRMEEGQSCESHMIPNMDLPLSRWTKEACSHFCAFGTVFEYSY